MRPVPKVTIPAGSTATVLLPAANASKIHADGKSLAKSAQVQVLPPVGG